MHIVRFIERSGSLPRIGVVEDDRVSPVSELSGFAELLSLDLVDARCCLERAERSRSLALETVVMLPPADGLVEVWASGVTYERSVDARVQESQVQDVYTRVYSAERPELFFKSPAWRVVTNGEPVAMRPDSSVTVPEPELALLLTARGQIFGYTVCNDMSSRDIEGANPLYLPQAKIYAGSCALGAAVRPAWEITDAMQLTIRLEVRRGRTIAFSGVTSTAKMRRSLDELVEYLMRSMDFPAGAVLATGTGIVPDLDFTLRMDDVIDISIEEVGTLTNPVRTIQEANDSLRPTKPV